MSKRSIWMGMMSLVAIAAVAWTAGAVTDRNLTERGQMPPGGDTALGFGHHPTAVLGASFVGPHAGELIHPRLQSFQMA